MSTPRLGTARLLLREWREDDKPVYAELNADPEVMAHFPATLTATQSDEMVDRMAASWTDRGYGLWAVEVVDDPGGVRGFVGFVGLSSPSWQTSFTPCVEVGWRLHRRSWGRGYAPEAARAALAWGFAELDLPGDEVVSFTTVANAKSRRVMEKLGMSHDPADDFDHPLLPDWHERRHVLYRLSRASFVAGSGGAGVPR
ncbi:MAG: GNAT family N-acetyltransferase [Ilumatobacteraceae bacterium]|nr:GNAT family N-acetyltransferase [Acidimicrobiales bacterium]MCB9395451.1 GNAT family N-acetyltransferase [Acidimicrobiaceae bacterium]